MSDKIEVGDKVKCLVASSANDSWEISGTVLSVPCATGDAWHIRDNGGKVVYIQTYLMITRHP